mmetsp:Transcript_14077/g.30515  ORF Transcript_14077/g.30515 Transcript_14077/m.30515 type:complete len:466 (+) Transcript_14077:51-1448(+)|eukprot:CAMPEP_0202903028 /NCGR_PEP_ID=MMETSP1392-20130828/20405_1 /ASSEMBLY_ACC=CAM_ASM_000868 /TAXON_ID=225041 /ORGANISM="Chlamydomonas chlamydogama, Strain SAG 11-48b" /LENGTH=465 /DNA_ID=CAMNT_0049589983 /DNA_START=50 /DNA_END=1447 /DNA_ORIENTATION=-
MAASDTELDDGPSSPPICGSLSECFELPAEHETREQGLEEFERLPADDVHLPDGVVRNIASYLVNESSSLLSLLAMCGTCRQWRSVAQELNNGVCLSYDGFDNVFSNQPAVQRFRKLSATQKEEVFASAAKLFTGYTEANFSGDGISDRVLVEVTAQVGKKLGKCKVHSSSVVTDSGLGVLISNATNLKSLILEDLSKMVTGKFLVTLFERCEQLQTLHLSNIPCLHWGACKAAAYGWREKGLTKLHVRGVSLDSEFGIILSKLTKLTELEIDGPARNIKVAATSCALLKRVSYQVSCRGHLDEALAALMNLADLRQLELIVKNFTLCSNQLRVIGMLPLVELRLDSYIYKQQPTLSRSSYSHVDNEGVKALVDSICNKWCAGRATPSEVRPLKLSLCGATALTHDAVSALLRLPVLTELDIGGCCRIIAMDKMRLVAKVRAGREMLESGRMPSARSSRFPGLML